MEAIFQKNFMSLLITVIFFFCVSKNNLFIVLNPVSTTNTVYLGQWLLLFLGYHQTLPHHNTGEREHAHTGLW